MHTFNPWRGCTRVSEGCRFCYAEALSKRNPAVLGEWGPAGTRVVASEAMWREPLKWDRAAKLAGERHRVFCASLADVFDEWPGTLADTKGRPLRTCPWSNIWGPTSSCDGSLSLDHVRYRLLNLIMETPNLDWLLLTKRPENIGPCLQRLPVLKRDNVWDHLWPKYFPNVWLGVSVENQATADERIPHLLKTSAAVRFLSCEPLLGPIDLARACPCGYYCDESVGHMDHPFVTVQGQCHGGGIHWVIVGGESGPKARPMHPDWARAIRDQCQAAGVALHFKQHGEWFPSDQYDYDTESPALAGRTEVYIGPDGQIVRTSSPFEHGCPCCVPPGYVSMVRVGKNAAGRLLDGRTWDQFPATAEAPAR
jgi:protein gp37